ncbi:ketosteroid isomerase [Sphingomonas sp. Root710]|uniref:nuclear transport factor 2 family protein n=1 Tax=Sphingomonas sp. Root710 TaxID=1736594 RepID=UPI0006FF51F1|nr:nuclear transport factor 2 family protein [Sphingomonas sp. Root710]KRB85249.1 ketosteroid isomerase [Sphingomonas sp. Root710]
MAHCPVEDRMAIEDLIVAYAAAVDSMSDLDGICAIFTGDAEFDLSGIGMTKVVGHAAIRSFYEAVFAANSHHAHYLSNFAVSGYDGDSAVVRCYVQGMAQAKDGGSLTVHGRYHFAVVRTAAGWKATRYHMDFLMPLPAVLADARGEP